MTNDHGASFLALDSDVASPLAGVPVDRSVAASPWPSVLVRGDLSNARREWLHTNGAGAYASSTLAGMHTRRYHGLLVAALDPPRGRHVFLSHVDATILRPRGTRPMPPGARPGSRPTWELAKHQFPGVDPKTSPFYLERFDQDPLPRWTYAVAEGSLEVTLALVRGENAVVLRYAWVGPRPVDLSLRPLIATRNFHQLQREHGGMMQRVELRPGNEGSPGRSLIPPGEMRVQPRREIPRLCFRYEGTFVGSPDWWRRFEYLAEQERGLDYQEDLWTPGVFEMPIHEEPIWLLVGVERLPDGDPSMLMAAARNAILAQDPGPTVSRLERRLTLAASVFRADAAPKPGILAGYPWFEVWGREALIALPGLYLVPKQPEKAIPILRELLGAIQDGLVPSRLPEPTTGNGSATPCYDSADPSLWLFEAARLLADALGDGHAFVQSELFPALHSIFETMLRGNSRGIHITADGLFAAGNHGDTLTWMDARVGGKAVTSRAGCPIELSALWSRGAETLARLARTAGDEPLAARAEDEQRRTRASFHQRFWCNETSYPYDVISKYPDGEGSFRDASVRPNAVVALAVDPGCFTPERATMLLERARRDLVTPAGLRTIASAEPNYVGRYSGNVAARDSAYHQGSTRLWLLGFYARAALHAGVEDRSSIERMVTAAAENEIALGHSPELADGDAPHRAGGCFAYAPSVGELLRVLAWDLR